MSSELERLRADLEVIKRLRGQESSFWTMGQAETLLTEEIARLEAEAADPWRLARNWIQGWRVSDYNTPVVAFFDHLTAERDRLAARVAELEADSFRRQAVIKQANELCVNDVIVDGGMIRTVTGVTFEEDQYKVVCGGAIRWYDKGNSVAVVPGPLAVASPDPDDPILEPARVLATAAGIMEKQGWVMTTKTREDLMGNVQPYRLKGGGDD